MTTIPTWGGGSFDLVNPRWQDVCIDDIAHALAHLCRYCGHTRSFYSVAQHSVLVAFNLPPALRRQGLLHDAPEAYVGDPTRPLKTLLPDFPKIEARVWWAVSEAFDLPLHLDPEVKRVDDAIIVDEWRAFMPAHADSGVSGPGLGIKITPWPIDHARRAFLDLYHELTAA